MNFFLSEIHRQARESAIIRMATQAREEGWIDPGKYTDPTGHTSIADYKSDPEWALRASQILVGRNLTRHNVNSWVRGKKGFDSSLPMQGERLICLRNDHELGVLNGGFFESLQDAEGCDEIGRSLLHIKSLDFTDRDPLSVIAHNVLFGGDKEQLKPWEWNEAQCFDYGYAITTHKAQGSQFEHVMINAEWPNKDSWKNWLYTATTRAQYSQYVVLPH